MSGPGFERLGTADLVEGLQLGHAVWTLHELKVLDSMDLPSTVQRLAAKHRLDMGLLRGVLEYVSVRTDLIRKIGTRFVVTGNYSGQSRFLLDLYTGAYGRNAIELCRLLTKPSLAPRLVDRFRHARAFQQVGPSAFAWIEELVRRLKWNYVLDIGCGAGTLLVQLARKRPEFVGWGLEISSAMRKLARANVRAARVGRRVKILEGDSRRLRSYIPTALRSSIQTLVACHVANEMFGNGSSGAVSWLAEIRRALPGRPLLIADYYGRLGSKSSPQHSRTLLHDYAQLISGQGVPPARIEDWQGIYAAAGCHLAHVTEDKSSTRFIHVVML